MNENDARRALEQAERFSAWMINIGTHRKPYDDTEFEFYADSLRNAIQGILDDDDSVTSLFFPVVQDATGHWVQDKRMSQRGINQLQITGATTLTVVERGTRTRRIDAHIIVKVRHGNTRLQFDHTHFADLLQETLMAENEMFREEPFTYGARDPMKLGQTLEWPTNGRPYVSFRLISRFDEGGTIAYMSKTWLTTDQERDILRENLDVLRDQAGFSNVRLHG